MVGFDSNLFHLLFLEEEFNAYEGRLASLFVTIESKIQAVAHFLSQLLVLSAVATAALDAAIAAQAALAAVLCAAGLVVHAQVLARRLVPVALAAVSLARAGALARDVGRIQAKGIRPAGDAVVACRHREGRLLALNTVRFVVV